MLLGKWHRICVEVKDLSLETVCVCVCVCVCVYVCVFVGIAAVSAVVERCTCRSSTHRPWLYHPGLFSASCKIVPSNVLSTPLLYNSRLFSYVVIFLVIYFFSPDQILSNTPHVQNLPTSQLNILLHWLT